MHPRHHPQAEAEANWAAWTKDTAVPRDHKGPRGFLRLWVATRDTINRYEKASKEAEIERSQRLSKHLSGEALQSKMNVMMSGGVGWDLGQGDQDRRMGRPVPPSFRFVWSQGLGANGQQTCLCAGLSCISANYVKPETSRAGFLVVGVVCLAFSGDAIWKYDPSTTPRRS